MYSAYTAYSSSGSGHAYFPKDRQRLFTPWTQSVKRRKVDVTHIASRPTLRDSVVTERTEPQTGAEEMRLNSHLVQSILSDKDIEGEPLKMLKQNDAFWKALKEQPLRSGQPVVRKRAKKMQLSLDYDVVVCGGTLGIFIATALQMRGHRVCILEKGILQGRTQEWNISRHELQNLVSVGVVTSKELEESIATEFNPNRVAFTDRLEMWVEDILNIGVSPRILIEKMKQRFQAVGGCICEEVRFRSAEVFQDGVVIKVGGKNPAKFLNRKDEPSPSRRSPTRKEKAGDEVTARLVIDCMGHWSPIVKQMRRTSKPDGICLVVGSCAAGFPAAENTSGDFLRTITDGSNDMQLFWEAFPAEGGKARTTYMFTYCDAHRSRPSLEGMLHRYFELLPEYTGRKLADLKFKRVLCAGLPCYENGPLQTQFDRVIQIGDASSSASPLSFGGFGSMVRHLDRLTRGLDEALTHSQLSQKDLQLLQPYQPALSAAWLFQRSMAFQVGQIKEARGRRGQVTGTLPPNHVNRLLACNFRVMKLMGDWVLRPFLQDTIRWLPLTAAMNGMLFSDPVVISRVVTQLGPGLLLKWLRHYWSLALYTALHYIVRPMKSVFKGFQFARMADAWTFGAGLDSPKGDLRNGYDGPATPAGAVH